MHSVRNVTMLPPSLATLTGLSRLAVERCAELDSGMRHLRPLTRLTLLSLGNLDGGLLPTFLTRRPGQRIAGLHRHWAN